MAGVELLDSVMACSTMAKIALAVRSADGDENRTGRTETRYLVDEP